MSCCCSSAKQFLRLIYPESLEKTESDNITKRVQKVDLECFPGPQVLGDPPNFTGSYVQGWHEGDIEQFMSDMGVARGKIMMMRVLKYGAGLQSLEIAHSGDFLSITSSGSMTYTQQLRVGGGCQKVPGSTGELLITPSWEGNALRLLASPADHDTAKCLRWFYFEGLHLVTAMHTEQGTDVKIFYRRI
eukprot:TRINITY_DN65893_c0_g1_i1.p1 TRINITY_DN65893_c0_g1~~TRINITY_DN65893_c0_g1_i1.p1  ORF type:complete len:189 (+),score=31.91 TRINITY_DN65893_c0_g1_i1:74-640(+)